MYVCMYGCLITYRKRESTCIWMGPEKEVDADCYLSRWFSISLHDKVTASHGLMVYTCHK